MSSVKIMNHLIKKIWKNSSILIVPLLIINCSTTMTAHNTIHPVMLGNVLYIKQKKRLRKNIKNQQPLKFSVKRDLNVLLIAGEGIQEKQGKLDMVMLNNLSNRNKKKFVFDSIGYEYFLIHGLFFFYYELSLGADGFILNEFE